MSEACDCCSGETYEACCGPRHTGAAPAPSAEALMRSRYSAFARADAQYLVDTWGEASQPSLEELQADLEAQVKRGERWVKLKVHMARGEGDDQEGEVVFEASLLSAGHLTTLLEVSQFQRQGGVWRYVGGDPKFNTRKLGRNEPCPCGCGGKVKRCLSAR